jgi:hypothetical protein
MQHDVGVAHEPGMPAHPLCRILALVGRQNHEGVERITYPARRTISRKECGGLAAVLILARNSSRQSIEHHNVRSELLLCFDKGRDLPPWDGDELALKVRNAYKYGKNAPGADAVSFTPLEFPASDAVRLT